MDNSVLDSSTPEPMDELAQLQSALDEAPELRSVLKQLQDRLGLSVNQMAVSAQMDESVLHKLLKGEAREFKPEHVDALLDDLQTQKRLTHPAEVALWHRALRIAAHVHYTTYKTLAPRLYGVRDVEQRARVLAEYLKREYRALAETYDVTKGQFPAMLPLADLLARQLLNRWGWVEVPPGYDVTQVTANSYGLISADLLPKPFQLGAGFEVQSHGFGSYTVYRRGPRPHWPLHLPQPSTEAAPAQPEPPPPAEAPQRSTAATRQAAGIEWVRIPAGRFYMGGRDTDEFKFSNETPQHVVELTYAYWIARCPVTNAQFRAFVDATGYRSQAELGYADSTWLQPRGKGSNLLGKESHPVVQVTWDDALAYCHWLTGARDLPRNGQVRLPTEAEWEKAARGAQDQREYPWGEVFDAARCNISGSGIGSTSPVGIYPAGASPYGCLDMMGNVWEWTQSQVKDYPYQPDDGRENLQGDNRRVVRGGSFRNELARCASRDYYYNPVNRYSSIGFRVCVVSPALSF